MGVAMHYGRFRTRGVALIGAVVVLVVAGTGVGVAVSGFSPGANGGQAQAFQSDGVTDDGDGAVNATSTPEGSDSSAVAPESSGESELAATETDASGDATAETATETGPETSSSTATPATTDAGDGATDDGESGTVDVTDEGSTDREGNGTGASNATETPNATAETSASGAADDGTASTPSQGALSSCAVIDESGLYELAGDVDGGTGTCLAIRASDVVLDGNGYTVAGPGSGTGVQVAGSGIANVTVRNVNVRDWDVAVQLGGSGGSGPQANLVEVRATRSATGVRLVEADGSAMQAVTARNNGDGLVLVDTADVQASDVTVAGNEDTGLWLARGVADSSFSIVQATDNGGRGIHVATGAVDNFIGDATVTGNGGPGVEFADSSDNVLADSRIENNGGAGVLSYPAGGDRLENVVVRGNGDGAYRDEGELAGVVGDTVHLGDDASIRFGQGVTRVARVETPSGLPDATETAGPAVDVALRDGDDSASATVTVPVETSDDVTAYQRVDGSWQELDATVVDGEVEIPVSRSGVVVPIVESSDDQPTTGNDGGTVRADLSTGDEPDERATTESSATDAPDALDGAETSDGAATDPDRSVDRDRAGDADERRSKILVIGAAAENATVEYALRVDGNLSKVSVENVPGIPTGTASADGNDLTTRTDGTVRVNGTASGGDAYVVDGEFLQVRQTGGESGLFVRYDTVPAGNGTRP